MLTSITAPVIVSGRSGVSLAMCGMYFHTSTPMRGQKINLVDLQQPCILLSISSKMAIMCAVSADWLACRNFISFVIGCFHVMSQTPPAIYMSYVGKSWLKDIATSARFLKVAPFTSLARILVGRVSLNLLAHKYSCKSAPLESVNIMESLGMFYVVRIRVQ